MTKTLFLCLAGLSLLLGCESTPHYDRTKIVELAPASPKKPYGTVKLFENKTEVPGPYDVIAFMSVEGKAGEEAAFIKAFLYRAADIGADAVILYRGNVVGGTEAVGAATSKGGVMIQSLSQDAVYRGEAIHLKGPLAKPSPGQPVRNP